MTPVMLERLAPLVEVVVAAAVNGAGEGLAAAPVRVSQAKRHGNEGVWIDCEIGHGRPEPKQAAHGVGRGSPVEAALCSLPAFVEPGAQGRDGRCILFAFCPSEFFDRVEQGGCVAGRGKPASQCLQPIGETEKNGLRQPRPDQNQERAKSFQTLAIVVHDDVGDHGGRGGPGGEYLWRALQGNAANGDHRASDPRSPFADAGETLRLPGHHLQLGLVNGPERHVVWLGGQRVVELCEAMRADTELDAGRSDGVEVSAGEVSLAEMYEVGTEVDRLTPIVVDHELATLRRSHSKGSCDLSLERSRLRLLDAKLNELCALARDAGNPGGVGKYGIKRIEPARAQETRSILKKGVPATGVDGDAMSRGLISPASKPRRPASIAQAKACAIFTGSPALATAVLSSTAS